MQAGAGANTIVRLICLGLGLIGLILLGVAFLLFTSTQSFLGKAVKTTGTVVGLNSRYSSSSNTTTSSTNLAYYPVFSFQDNEGHSYNFESNIGSNPAAYSVGQQVTILFDPAKPTDFKPDDFISTWLGTIITGVIGVVMLGAALAVFLITRRL